MFDADIRPEFRALDYLITRFDLITSQVPSSESARQAIEAAAEEVLDLLVVEVQDIVKRRQMH